MSVTFSQLGKLGRFGNSLFQIAATVGYAKKYDMSYSIPLWEPSKYFKNKFNHVQAVSHYSNHIEKAFSYNRIPRYIHVDLYGYYQSIKYWDNCESEIRELFAPNDEIQLRINKFKETIPDNVCAIHVRRTDYLTLPEHHNNLTIDYYNDAMKAMNAEAYIVFSDDIDWCKDNILGDNIIFMKSANDIQDFFIMSQCRNFIIANSSFSWWASYLSDNTSKRIIAPSKDKWFGKQYNKHSVDDLYLKSWELI